MRYLVTGGAGFLGARIVAELHANGVSDVFVPRSADYDLRTEHGIGAVLADARPEVVIHAAGLSGGIGANRSRPAEMFYDNAVMGIQMMEFARRSGVEKFVTVGTVCSYPKFAPAPFREQDLWMGYPEETNAAYGIAKKSLLVMGDAYRAQYGLNVIHLLLVNLYGPGDKFDPKDSHVIAALIRRFIEAADDGADSVVLWGTGEASREFIYVDDAATAIVGAALRYNGAAPVNIGSGSEITIRRLAETVAELVGYEGRIEWDPTMPDGQPKRLLDVERAATEFGFRAQTPLAVGLAATIDWYREAIRKPHVAR
jgi:GDP-L-fucose synthase